ncbi:hypothetical protein [Paenibacillus donghaensis]|uniref:Uncharacterized protein n=1 Tax=Paenibacillus donghaensis TaxID=414771 RepID=A0A2Z2KYL8_9BACL|nr:hypothetical protein [Paenibacillus donghaensis]ASA25658.1 hypothetical protein B9T62_35970 [Paenibacillus donghaensis]
MKKENDVIQFKSEAKIEEVKVYENFNYEIETTCITEVSDKSKIFYVDVEQIDKKRYKAREAFKFKLSQDSNLENSKLIDCLNVQVNRAELYFEDIGLIDALLLTKVNKMSYCDINILPEYVEITFKDYKGYNDFRKHIHIIEYFYKFLLCKDVYLTKVKFYNKGDHKYSVHFSKENNFTSINGGLNIQDKVALMKLDGLSVETFFKKWFYFFSTKDSQHLLSGLRYVYMSYGYRNIGKNIQEVVSMIEGVFSTVGENSSETILRTKLKSIMDKLTDSEKKRQVSELDIYLLLDDDDIDTLLAIRNKEAHSTKKKKRAKAAKGIYKLCLGVMKVFELYLMLTVRNHDRSKVKKSENVSNLTRFVRCQS